MTIRVLPLPDFPHPSTRPVFGHGAVARSAVQWAMAEADPKPADFLLYYRVVAPFVGPVSGRAGQLMSVWLGHPTHTVMLYAPGGTHVVRHAHVAPGVIYSLMLQLEQDGVVRYITSVDASRLSSVA